VDATTLHSKSHNSPFVGKSYTGRVELCILRGATCFAAKESAS